MQSSPATRTLNGRDLRSLLQITRPPCISIFLSSDGDEAASARPDRLRILLRQAREELLAGGISETQANSSTEPIERLASCDALGQQPGSGLAIYRSPGTFRAYPLPARFRPQFVVGDCLYVKPLLPLLSTGGRFFVLALTEDSARLFHATRHEIQEIELPVSVRSEFGRADAPPRPPSPGDHRDHGGEPAGPTRAFAKNWTKVDALNYYRRLNDSVTQILQHDDVPLVLACVGYLAPLYESANSHPHLIKAKVPGSPTIWTESELRKQAWKLASDALAERKRDKVAAVRRALTEGQALTNLDDSLIAAREGRVDQLLLAISGLRRSEEAAGAGSGPLTEQGDGALELNAVAAETLKHGGEVLVVDDLPGLASTLAATTRR